MLLLMILLYVFRDMMNLILLTFLFSYLFSRGDELLLAKFKKLTPKLSKAILTLLSTLLFLGVIYALVHFAPVLASQFTDAVIQVKGFINQTSDNELINYGKNILESILHEVISSEGMNFAANLLGGVSKSGMDVFLSLILSLFFLVGKDQVRIFTSKFKKSKIAVVYQEFAYYGQKFVSSFGKVIEVQIIISLINSIFSALGLYLIGFSNILGFGVMIFILGLIPVAGVAISLVPLCIVAFNIGGMLSVTYVILMIGILHGLESYFLNPKLMSSKTALPVFYTFVILVVGEHFFGVWGLIIGIPMFMFILDLLEVPLKDEVSQK
ncbi:MAG: AI-2E family transporter [Lachnospiraceae bacterium]